MDGLQYPLKPWAGRESIFSLVMHAGPEGDRDSAVFQRSDGVLEVGLEARRHDVGASSEERLEEDFPI